MKKAWILGILGLGVALNSSYGQGHINFSNYGSSASPTINIAGSGLAVGGSYAAELYWGNGVITDSSLLTPIASTLTYFSFNGPGPNSTADGDIYNAANPNGNGAGWFFGPNATLTGYTSGPATFEVVVFNDGSLANATMVGYSALFQQTPAVGTGGVPQTSFAAFTVSPVPEPTTLALGGLGLASLVVLRRKKA